MRRLLLPGMLALGLHILFFSTKADWMKGKATEGLQSQPIALALSYTKPQRMRSISEKSAEHIKKISVPSPKKPTKKEPKLDPPKKPKKTIRKQTKKPPKVVKKPRQTQKRKPPKSIKPPPEITKSKPIETEDRVEQEVIPDDIFAFETAWSLKQEGTEMPILLTAYGEEQNQLAALPGKEDISSPPPIQGIREAIPIYKKNPPPKYPRIARLRRFQGKVIIEILVNREGRVGDLRLLKSSGYAILDRAAMKSVRNWVFEPGMRGDKKVEMWVKVPIRFQIK